MAVMLLLSFKGDVLAQGSADIMHKPRGLQKKNRLISVFGNTLRAAKKNDWTAITGTIKEIDERIEEYKLRFGIDLKPRLEKAVTARNPGQTLKILAQVIYFGLKVELEAIMGGQIEDYLDSRSRLHRAKDYYIKILSGNVKKKNPMGHQKIQEQFILAEAALGNPGFDITMPEAPPDLKEFEKATRTIETELIKVYAYFNG